MEEILSREGGEVKVSIGICAYNEEGNIGELLDNLLTKQDLPQNSEIIVICSGCTDSTPEIVRKFCENDDRVKLIKEEERQGKAAAVNRILDAYTGDYLFFIPADVKPDRGCLNKLLRKFTDNKIGVVGGRPVPVNDETTLLGSMVHVLWKFHHYTLSILNHEGVLTHASGELACMRRGIVEKVPSSIVNDDAYIALKANKQGYLIKYEPEARVHIEGPTTVIDFIRQRRRVVYGHFQIKARIGNFPRTLECMALYDQKRVIRVLTTFLKNNPKQLHNLFFTLAVEALVNLIAFSDILFGKNHLPWKTVRKTRHIAN